MTAAAAVTTDLRVGCRVFNVDLHHPVVLAKEMATLDLLSDGRLEVGLGAGWVAAEYEGLGVPMDRPGVRIARLGEVVGLMKAHWSGDEMAVDGTYVHASGFAGLPLPVQQPASADLHRRWPRADPDPGRTAGRHRQLQLRQLRRQARVGERRQLRRGETEQKLEWVRAGAGDRFDEIELEIGAYFVAVSDDPASDDRGDGAAASASARSEFASHPHALLGTSTRSAPPSTSGASGSASRTSPSRSATSTTSPPSSPASLAPDDRPTAMPDS